MPTKFFLEVSYHYFSFSSLFSVNHHHSLNYSPLCGVFMLFGTNSPRDFFFLFPQDTAAENEAGHLSVYLNCKLGAAQLLF